jgi:hypothetical protein
MSGQPFDSHHIRKTLIAAAEHQRIRSPDAAAGMCLTASVEFALAASKLVSLQLVRWRVVQDPAYCEHWALLLNEDEVLDLTHVQVDGDDWPVHALRTYPTHYRDPRLYPCELLTELFAQGGTAVHWHTLARARLRIHGFDIRQARWPQKPVELVRAGGGLLRYALVTTCLALLQRLLARHTYLQQTSRTVKSKVADTPPERVQRAPLLHPAGADGADQ